MLLSKEASKIYLEFGESNLFSTGPPIALLFIFFKDIRKMGALAGLKAVPKKVFELTTLQVFFKIFPNVPVAFEKTLNL